MTRRVVDCQRQFDPLSRLATLPSLSPPPPRLRGFTRTIAAALLLVPIAGAAEPPLGWTTATCAALSVLLLGPVLGARAPWGLFAGLCGALLLFSPRGQLAAAGPAVLVAMVLFGILWAANRPAHPPSATRRATANCVARAEQVRHGQRGEHVVKSVLAEALPDEFVVINGLKLPRAAGDIDHLVIGPTGCFVIETKTMAGRIVCDDTGTWRRTRSGRSGGVYPAYIGDPAAQVQRNIFAVRRCLQARLPRLFGPLGLWIEGLVIFAHPQSVLDTSASRIPVVRLDTAAAHPRGFQPRRALSPADVEAIVSTLLEADEQPAFTTGASAQSAQALVELAVGLPLVLALLIGTIALSRLVQAQIGLVGLVHDVARAGALALTPADALDRMNRRLRVDAPGLGLNADAVVLECDVSEFTAADNPRLVAAARYRVDFRDLPVFGWSDPPLLRAEHVEWLDPFRSGVIIDPAGRR